MIPKPPFAWELTPEAEVAEYERLQARLPSLWADVFPRDDEHYTTVVVPSLTLEPEELARIEGASLFEEQLLFFLIRLRNPRARIVYVTSSPLHPLVLDYYLQLLAGIPGSHARARLTLVCAYDATPRPLIEKVLERPRLIERIRSAIPDRSRTYMTVFNSTPLERRLAVLLGIPVNGLDPRLAGLGTKSGSRRFFRDSGLRCTEGFEDLRDRGDIETALGELRARKPHIEHAVIKLDRGVYGEGNAIFSYPMTGAGNAAVDVFQRLAVADTWASPEAFLSAVARRGCVVEELIEGGAIASPSVQIRINPRREVSVSSTHEQILGGATGQCYLGCRFPAVEAYRRELHAAGIRIGRLLADRGVVSRLSVDFLVQRSGAGYDLRPVEIDFRAGSTTHSMLALRFLTEGRLDPDTGLFHSPLGRTKFYRATESLQSAAYRGLVPEDLIEILTLNHLDYSPGSETGVVFQMLGGISQFGRVGLVAIGNSPVECEDIYRRTVAVLDHEAAMGCAPPAH